MRRAELLNTCCVVGYTSKAGKDILIFHNSRASMDCDLHSEQPNVGYLRTYRSKSDLAYSYNRAMGISIRWNLSIAMGVVLCDVLQITVM